MILEDVRKNKLSSFFIVSFFILVIMIGVYAICMYYEMGAFSIVFALLFSILPATISYYNCDKIILSLNGARKATREQDLLLTSLLEGLCIATGLPMPKIYVIEDEAMNAFATGRNPEHAVVCVTTGLLARLDKYELEGVLAHELSHIRNYDILLSTIVTVFVGFVVILSDYFIRSSFRRGKKNGRNGGGSAMAILAIAFLILSPIFAQLMQLAISRKREYLADASAIEITRNKEGLKNALLKISGDSETLEVANKSTAHLYIVNPFKEQRRAKDNWFSTHPATENRIQAIENIK